MVRFSWVCLLLVMLAPAQAARGQGLDVRLHGGIIKPVSSTAEYFRFGPSVGVDIGVPISDVVSVMLDVGWEWLQTQYTIASPTTNLWRYGLALEFDLLKDPGDDTFMLHALVGAGGTTSTSHKFWLKSRQPYDFYGHNINQTAMSAGGGLRFGLRTEDGIEWWLTSKINWSPVTDHNAAALRELSRDQLDLLSAETTASIQMGVTLW
jgi:hypothetical protein